MKISRLLNTLLISTAVLIPSTTMAEDIKKVAVSQIVEHPALDSARMGILDGLAKRGYKEGSNLEFTFQTAQGNPAIAVQIARQFVGEQPDVLVGIATPSAQALAAATKNIPIVFTAVTDPIGARLLTDMNKPSGNITGLSDLSPVFQHVALAKEVLPEMKTIGVIYNPGEANSVSLLALLKQAAAKYDLNVVEGTALRSADVQSAAQIVASKSDAIYALTDNTMGTALDSVVAVSNQAGIPVIAADTGFTERGALVGLGFDYYQIGLETAEYVADILDGKSPNELPAKVATGSDLFINKKAAQILKMQLPDSVVQRATKVIR
ncbi:ABC transporter substrate binding protein [Veronia pacifica]|uniref:ABC transporter substrate-binding protein n=1 Tax=Veronia pacifica TaxID=1080227 RepID=A0A1C3EMM4_9GAMM|nr:ABC transporter substrate-binding protein [Veronia pacifica]ODA34484.1 ABC transporter substrate-binding protein [Veronia pacifica]